MTFAVRAILSAAAFALLAPGAARAQTEPGAIYADALAPGWSNWSWANVTLGVRASEGERPIMIEAPAWSALYLQHAGFDTHGYSTLSFWINGGSSGGQTLSVVAVINGEGRTEDYFRVSPEANTWTQVDVPLAAIGAADRVVSGFWIQNGSAEPAERFFVNQIALR